MDSEEPSGPGLNDADASTSKSDTTALRGGARLSGEAADGSSIAVAAAPAVALGTRRRSRPVREEKDPGIWPHTTRILPWLAAAFLLMLWLVPFDSITAPFSLGADSKLDRVALSCCSEPGHY